MYLCPFEKRYVPFPATALVQNRTRVQICLQALAQWVEHTNFANQPLVGAKKIRGRKLLCGLRVVWKLFSFITSFDNHHHHLTTNTQFLLPLNNLPL